MHQKTLLFSNFRLYLENCSFINRCRSVCLSTVFLSTFTKILATLQLPAGLRRVLDVFICASERNRHKELESGILFAWVTVLLSLKLLPLVIHCLDLSTTASLQSQGQDLDQLKKLANSSLTPATSCLQYQNGATDESKALLLGAAGLLNANIRTILTIGY